MAKTQIYEQNQALSLYFDDMLSEPKPRKNKISAEPVSEPEPKAETQTALAPPPQVEQPPEAQMPEQATEGKQTDTYRLLLCEIDDLKLALPIATLNNIVRWPQAGLSEIATQADWQMGTLSHKGKASQIIDLRVLLNPDSVAETFQPSKILLIDDCRWGIACNHIQQIVTYQYDDINWQQDLAQSPLITGIVSDRKYQLVDISGLLALLQ